MAARLHRAPGEAIDSADQQWGLDLMILNLGAYHFKNEYSLTNWALTEAGQSPADDPLLQQYENRFFAARKDDPTDVTALNGLGTTLMCRRDLKAREFFIRTAIARAEDQGISYPDAQHDWRCFSVSRGESARRPSCSPGRHRQLPCHPKVSANRLSDQSNMSRKLPRFQRPASPTCDRAIWPSAWL